MGRYYNGDINGKFWFGVQSSNDASFFAEDAEYEPNYISYSFYKDEHMDSVKEGVAKCYEKLGENKVKLDEFFDKVDLYNEKSLTEATGIKKVGYYLEWFARS